MGPYAFLGALKGTYRVYSGYRRIPGLRAHTRDLGFNLRSSKDCVCAASGLLIADFLDALESIAVKGAPF